MITETEELIWQCFGGGAGSPVMTCACGRINYAGGRDMDEGELDKLDAENKKNPDKYCSQGEGDSVVGIEFNGATRIFGCDCHWEGKLARLLDDNERVFIEYYRRKSAQKLKEAQESIDHLKGVNV